MVEDPDVRALRLAHRLGVVAEALRLRGTAVGTEHVLMATLADPVVRSALHGVGVDLRDAQALVTRASDARPRRDRPGVWLTGEAAAAITRVGVETPGLDPERKPDPTVLSTALGALMTAFLHDEQDTAARRILDELGLGEHATRIATVIGDGPGSWS